jgi:hypothetical protein
MDGPFDIFWGFGEFMIPLAVLELYFRSRDAALAPAKGAMAAALLALTGLMAVGIVGAWLFMWRPVLGHHGV